jgi:hypothetical protein
LDFYTASSLKQQSADKHVAPLGHIIPIPSRTVIALSPSCWVLGNLIKIRSLIAPDYVAQQNREAIKDRILIRLGA